MVASSTDDTLLFGQYYRKFLSLGPFNESDNASFWLQQASHIALEAVNLSKHVEAANIYQRMIGPATMLWGMNDIKTLQLQRGYANELWMINDLQHADEILQNIVPLAEPHLRKNVIGQEDRFLKLIEGAGESRIRVVKALFKRKHYLRAMRISNDNYKVCRRVLGEEHEITKKTGANFEICRAKDYALRMSQKAQQASLSWPAKPWPTALTPTPSLIESMNVKQPNGQGPSPRKLYQSPQRTLAPAILEKSPVQSNPLMPGGRTVTDIGKPLSAEPQHSLNSSFDPIRPELQSIMKTPTAMPAPSARKVISSTKSHSPSAKIASPDTTSSPPRYRQPKVVHPKPHGQPIGLGITRSPVSTQKTSQSTIITASPADPSQQNKSPQSPQTQFKSKSRSNRSSPSIAFKPSPPQPLPLKRPEPRSSRSTDVERTCPVTSPLQNVSSFLFEDQNTPKVLARARPFTTEKTSGPKDQVKKARSQSLAPVDLSKLTVSPPRPKSSNGFAGPQMARGFALKSSDSHPSDQWLGENLQATHQLYVKRPPPDPNFAASQAPESREKRRVRIAVLDTGLDFDHPVVERARSQGRIKRCRSFIDDPARTNVSDLDGHGTHVTMLLHKVAPEADIYVARVFEKSTGGSVEPVVKAVQHAISQEENGWDVDMICMAFGFLTDQPTLRDEILKAAANDVLMFAAATNKGANVREPSYPARDPNVFCIHATDAHGAMLTLNPLRKDSHYSTLGKDVKSVLASPPLSGVSAPSADTIGTQGLSARSLSPILHRPKLYHRRTGTSMACAIACGIAALVLELTRQPEVDFDKFRYVFNPPELKKLHTQAGMAKVFEYMMHDDGSDKFRYLAPWFLISTAQDPGDPSVDEDENISDGEKQACRERRAARACKQDISSALNRK